MGRMVKRGGCAVHAKHGGPATPAAAWEQWLLMLLSIAKLHLLTWLSSHTLLHRAVFCA